MFTGIITQKANVISLSDYKITVATNCLENLTLGESIAVNGVCLTVTSYEKHSQDHYVEFDLLPETINITNLADLLIGDKVNIERAMTANSLLGGHILSGHVDTTVKVLENSQINDAWVLSLEVPEKYHPLLIPKGSVALNGVSLTIQTLENSILSVQLIPETIKATNLTQYNIGSRMNVEFDAITKTIWHQLKFIKPT